jgi:hypothetical protein
MDAMIEAEPFLAKKLDAIGIPETTRQTLDTDPTALLAERCPGILHHVQDAFAWCKVDAVTAFGGHKGGDNLHYGDYAYGVDAIIEWIHWARGVAMGAPWRRWEARAARLLRVARNYGR